MVVMMGLFDKKLFDKIKYDENGLVPVVAQEAESGKVLMLAYMNREALQRTVETGFAHYYSRSRKSLWKKGETSGHVQEVLSISPDCDNDSLLIKVLQKEAACHTGHYSCFFNEYDADGGVRTAEKVFDPEKVYPAEQKANAADPGIQAAYTAGQKSCAADQNAYGAGQKANDTVHKANAADQGAYAAVSGILNELFDVITDRKNNPREGSYTCYLFEKGLDKILKKVGEECSEVIIASKNESRSDLVYEIADLFYHVLVLMAERGLKPEDIYEELKKRRK
jgi:phosphoribosyl-ATP pyrophosphohydrolase/phosphoribosyl-AMP cyclohydrolase